MGWACEDSSGAIANGQTILQFFFVFLQSSRPVQAAARAIAVYDNAGGIVLGVLTLIPYL
jgi:hypothetical protein